MPPKKSAKKAASPSATPSSPKASAEKSQPEPKTKGKRGPKKATQESEKSHSEILLESLISGAAVASAVDNLLHIQANESAESASCAVVNMVCKAAGVKELEIDAETILLESSIASTLEEMYARVPADSDVYFLNNKDAKYRRFKKAFPDFFQRLILSSAAADVLYEEGGIATAVQWLSAMSTSKARSFRHTATCALLAMIEGIGSRLAMLKESLQSQKKKDAAQTQKALDKLLELHDSIFNSLIQRSKDVAPEIRVLFTSALKTLCTKFPAQYISNNYLRCFAVSFYDKKSECRVEGYSALVEILGGVPDYADSMRDFFKYFAKRIVETCNDADTKVADLAIRLCSLLIRRDVSGDDIISTDMLDRILLGLFDERSIIRTSTGTFFKIHLRAQAGDAEGAVGRQTELLCAFLATLHEIQNEPLAERYVVDALWRNDNPPQVLTSYAPLLNLVKSASPRDASMGLRLLSAILMRIKEPLTFGPAAKDDVKAPAPKASGKNEVALEELAASISKDVVAVLSSVMDKHHGEGDVLAASAEFISCMDLNSLTSQKLGNSVRDIIVALRKGTAAVESTTQIASRILAAWRVLAFTEHPHKTEAEGQLHELLKQILKQLSTAEKPHNRSRNAQAVNEADVADVWGRVRMITSLVALKDQWVIFKTALTQHTLANASPRLLSNVAAVAFQGLIWLVGESQVDASIDPNSVSAQMADVAAMFVKILEAETPDDDSHDEHIHLKVDVFVYLADLCSLPHYTLPQVEQEAAVNSLFDLVETCAERLKDAQDAAKAVRPAQAQSITSALLQSRKVATAWEAAITRLSVSIVRLFIFKKISETFAPRVLLLWTKVSVRVASDCFKSLFHALRDRNKDSFKLEKNVLLAGHKLCLDLGMNPAALESFYQIGLKLASMHFLLTDKFYPACLAIVRFGVEYATTTDPVILQAVQPYCSKLRQSDALNVVNSLSHNDLFTTPSNVFIRSFISAVRRAAKMEEIAPFSGAPTPARSKRTREPTHQQAPAAEDDLLAEVVAKSHRKAYAGNGATPKSKASAAVTPSRVVNEDGWHVRRDAPPPKPSPKTTQRSKRTQPTSTQLSSLVDDLDDNEVFIATQEYA